MRIDDETESDLKQLIEQDFGQLGPTVNIWDEALAWVHYKAREIPQRSRCVIESSECVARRVAYPAIETIAKELRTAGDLRPWLSDSIRRNRADPKADLMFNDWQINHLHLGNVFVARDKVQRTGDLLFVYITSEKAVLLDVQPHGSWAMQSLLRILLRTSPEDMSRHELKGIRGTGVNYTADQVYELRKNGITAHFELEGKYFFSPGLGVTTSGHATRSRLYINRLRRTIKAAKKAIASNDLPSNLMSKIAADLRLPVRLGLRLDSGRIILFDKNRQIDLSYMPALQ
jgi:hypothetical protein